VLLVFSTSHHHHHHPEERFDLKRTVKFPAVTIFAGFTSTVVKNQNPFCETLDPKNGVVISLELKWLTNQQCHLVGFLYIILTIFFTI
jgi:hypothetical protein